MNTKYPPSKVRLRPLKAQLEVYLRVQSLTPSEQERQSLLEAIHALSLPEEEKRVLFQFFDPNEPPPEREVDYWKMEDRMRAVCRNLPETPESKRFSELVWKGHSKALAVDLAAVGWRENNEILRKHYEQTGDTHALGAVVGAIEAVDGPIEDIATIPEEWIRRGLSRATRKKQHVPTEGGGRKKKLTAKEARQNTRASNRTSQQTIRARRYHQKAWERYQAETQGITTLARIRAIAQDIAEEILARNTPAMNEARKWYWDEVTRASRFPQENCQK